MYIRAPAKTGALFLALSLYPSFIMSHAFIKETDDQWLHDIPPTMTALINYLTRENNGIRVYEQNSFADRQTGKMVYEMSNGLNYSIDGDSRWYIYG